LRIANISQSQNISSKIKKIDLKIDFNIPFFSQSLNTFDGSIYLITQNSIFKYEEDAKILKLKTKLRYPRIHPSIICDQKFIYIIGGLSEEAGIEICEDKCEKFDVATYNIKDISKMPDATYNSTSCLFKEKFIYLFGGKAENHNYYNKILCYNISLDSWKEIDPIVNELSREPNDPHHFILSYCQKAIQINKKEIYIFGSSNDFGSKENTKTPQYVFSRKEKNLNLLNNCKNGFEILNNYILFGNPVILKNNIWILGKKKNEEKEIPLKVLIFDSSMNDWI